MCNKLECFSHENISKLFRMFADNSRYVIQTEDTFANFRLAWNKLPMKSLHKKRVLQYWIKIIYFVDSCIILNLLSWISFIKSFFSLTLTNELRLFVADMLFGINCYSPKCIFTKLLNEHFFITFLENVYSQNILQYFLRKSIKMKWKWCIIVLRTFNRT